jgi:hypothetical protein
MFTYAYDEASGSALFLFSGPSNDDDDFVRYLVALDALDTRASGRTDAAIITFVESGNPPPSAKWRKKIGERSATLKTRPVAALVSSSPLIRGVVTMLDWFAPRRFEAQIALARYDDAVTWIESKRGPRRAAFDALLRESQAEARHRRGL